jgi:ribosomal protein S16
MAVVLRLSRAGTHKAPFYHVVATDSRNSRDGKYIEDIGIYDPTQQPERIEAQGRPRRALAQGRRHAQPDGRDDPQAGEDGAARGEEGVGFAMRDLVLWLARELVESKEAVKVEVLERDRSTVLELSVSPDDLGRVIGRGGRTAKALRTVLDAAARREGRRAVLDILD